MRVHEAKFPNWIGETADAITATVQMEGCEVVILNKSDYSCDEKDRLKPGDLYLAGRNGPLQILTCKVRYDEAEAKRRHPDQANPVCRWIMPVENAYSFDLSECYKIVSIDGIGVSS